MNLVMANPTISTCKIITMAFQTFQSLMCLFVYPADNGAQTRFVRLSHYQGSKMAGLGLLTAKIAASENAIFV